VRELSPSERVVLERAAAVVPVFERRAREKNEKVPDFQTGHFKCDCPVGPMRPGRLLTLFFVDAISDEWLCSVVICLGDRHWLPASERDTYWMVEQLALTHNQMGMLEFQSSIYSPNEMIADYGEHAWEPYVRILATPENGVQHVNSMVNLTQFFKEWTDVDVNLLDEDDMGWVPVDGEFRPVDIVRHSTHKTTGLYVDPMLPNNHSLFMPLQPNDLVKHPNFGDTMTASLLEQLGAFGKKNSPFTFKRIEPKRKMPAFKELPENTAWVEAWATNNNFILEDF